MDSTFATQAVDFSSSSLPQSEVRTSANAVASSSRPTLSDFSSAMMTAAHRQLPDVVSTSPLNTPVEKVVVYGQANRGQVEFEVSRLITSALIDSLDSVQRTNGVGQ
jgi:hypothetical protein